MGSLSMPLNETVPTLNLSEVMANLKEYSGEKGLLSNSPAVAKLVKEVRDACTQWGFFYVVGHEVDPKLIEDLRKVAINFFHKPKDFKKTIRRQENNYRGFTDSELTKQKLDWKEAFDFGPEFPEVEKIKNGIQMDAGKNQWPADMPQFKNTLSKYYSAMHTLSSVLMDLVFLSLNQDPATFKENFNEVNHTSWCRINYYPVNPHDTSKLGVGPHSDPGILTVLLQDDNVASLQVEKDGQFYNVPPVPNSYVINIGDMVQVWSNGLYQAPVHRVLSNPTKERFSIPFFFSPEYSTDIKPLPQTISSDRPKRYRTLNYGEFMQQRIVGNYADYGEEIQIYHFEINK